jgi:hypothetical protein
MTGQGSSSLSPFKYQGTREAKERGERDDILEDFERGKK